MSDEAAIQIAGAQSKAKKKSQTGPNWLCCRVCEHRIVLEDAGVSFDGGHTHRFINPHGLAFEIGLFDHASGCVHEGETVEFFSWFPGYTWRIALCGGCRAHLGWSFESIGAAGIGEPVEFDGIIIDRVRSS